MLSENDSVFGAERNDFLVNDTKFNTSMYSEKIIHHHSGPADGGQDLSMWTKKSDGGDGYVLDFEFSGETLLSVGVQKEDRVVIPDAASEVDTVQQLIDQGVVSFSINHEVHQPAPVAWGASFDSNNYPSQTMPLWQIDPGSFHPLSLASTLQQLIEQNPNQLLFPS